MKKEVEKEKQSDTQNNECRGALSFLAFQSLDWEEKGAEGAAEKALYSAHEQEQWQL